MPQVSLNTAAPNFNLQNFQGETVQLTDYRGKFNILLVFNRGFI
jgi:peroxiredoxin